MKPNLSRAKRPTGDIVMLKVVEPDVFAIHSLISIVKSNYNHTIPNLDEVALGIEKIIVMPKERVLADVSDSVFDARSCVSVPGGGPIYASAKRGSPDLKPENILVTSTQRLLIIDFGVSVQVPDQ